MELAADGKAQLFQPAAAQAQRGHALVAGGVIAVADGAVCWGTRVAVAWGAGFGAGLGDGGALDVGPRLDRGVERVPADLGGWRLRGALACGCGTGCGSTHGKALLDEQAPPPGGDG
ncbi:hypothetical protein XGA_0206, partial [Xanthomonas hortorum ATCC 19865]